MGVLQWCGVHGLESPNCRFEQEEIVIDGTEGTRRTLHTPEGSLTEESLNAAIGAAKRGNILETLKQRFVSGGQSSMALRQLPSPEAAPALGRWSGPAEWRR